jgi:hypothetical protein
MKENIKDILLTPIALIFNYLCAFIGFVFLTVFSQIIVGLNFNDNTFDQLIGNLTLRSFEGLVLIGFLYFLYIDLKTLISRKLIQIQEYEHLKNYSSKRKLLLNMAFNIFRKVPFENSLNESIKIYLLRILLIFIAILPFYIFQLFIFSFSLAPFLTVLLTLIILFGAALSYQFDTKLGKRIEKYFLTYISLMKPDKLDSLQKKCST